MKVKVLKRFRDKHTKKIYKTDSVIEVTEARLEEILKVGKLVEVVTENEDTELETEKKPVKTSKKIAK